MKSKVCFLIMVVLMVVSTCVYATPSASMGLTATSTSLKEGDEVTVTLKLNNVTDIEKGIFACQGTLDYDKNIFESVTSSSYKNGENWSGEFNPSNNQFATSGSVSGSGHKSGAIISFTLKVKASVVTKSTTITVKGIKVTDDNDDEVAVPNASVTISVTGTAQNNTDNGNNNSNQGSQSGSQGSAEQQQSSQPTTTTTTTSTTTDKTTSKSNLPKTGINEYAVIGIAIVAVIAVVSIIRYKNIIK